MSKIDELRLGFETAYINGSAASNSLYRPQFVSNNHKEGKKVLSSVEDELLKCDRFQISVAFITMSGITPLLQTLKELENKNIPGEILTTNYLNFSEPGALKKLNDLSNITLKMYDVEEQEMAAISRVLRPWYLVIHSRLPISQSLKIRKRESFLYQCQDTVQMSVMRKTA